MTDSKVITLDDTLEFARQVLQAEANAVLAAQEFMDDSFVRAVVTIEQCKGQVIVSGVGKSGIIAQKLSATFASTGTPSHFVHPTEALHGDLGRISGNDIILLLSYSGSTDEVLTLAAIAKQNSIPIIALTGLSNNPLSKLSKIALCIGEVTEACPHNLAPSVSTTAMLAVGDALALSVSRRIDFTSDQFHRFHPDGGLGRLMLPVAEAMRFRVGENLPLISETLTVEQVLLEADAQPRRSGAILLVNEDGGLTGIFTDADLRRLLLANGSGATLDFTIKEVMTSAPACLREDAPVREAVDIICERRVDEIPVLDLTGKPIGLIDVQDLIALKVLPS